MPVKSRVVFNKVESTQNKSQSIKSPSLPSRYTSFTLSLYNGDHVAFQPRHEATRRLRSLPTVWSDLGELVRASHRMGN